MTPDPSTRMRLLGIAIVAAAAFGFSWWAFTSNARAKDAASAPAPILQRDGTRIVVPERSPLRQSLRVAAVPRRQVEVPFALPASVESDPARLFKALPPVAGRVVRLDRNLGDRVAVGDPLFVLDSADLAQAVSDAQKARASLALTRVALERQRALGAADIAAQRDVEQATNDFEQAASESARAEARLSQLGAHARASVDGRALTVRSPIAGDVVALDASAGAYWNDVTAPLLTIADLSSVYVTASADEQDLGRVFVGQTVRVTIDAYPGETRVGQVHDVGRLLDVDTRRVKVHVRFANGDGRLKPGMFATATFVGRPHDALLVPVAAVLQSGFDSRVFVEVAPWTFEPRVVETGRRVGDALEIVQGLAPDARVVVKDGVLLND